jgi:hypothetical protein
MGLYLMPFAELAFGDELCFNYEGGETPEVVVWFHELSVVERPYTELVSRDFHDFLCSLG